MLIEHTVLYTSGNVIASSTLLNLHVRILHQIHDIQGDSQFNSKVLDKPGADNTVTP